jgi:cell wall-associated NlpC family hydrolase
MAAGNVMSRLRFAALMAAIFACAGTAHGQERSSGGRGSFGVPLQPFSLRETTNASPRAEPIRVAYYAPRAQPALAPRAESVGDEDDLETTNAFPEINSNRPVVAGDRAILRNGIAYAPSQAPNNIKNAIWAVNTLRRKPYVWGGGHGSFNDYGYDCSGAVSFALHYAGLLDAPLPSSDLCHYGRRGRGRWITIYSRDGHTFAIIAGLRLDTTDLRDGGAVGPRWYADGRDTHGFDARHPAGW